jgi:hypothetical protein
MSVLTIWFQFAGTNQRPSARQQLGQPCSGCMEAVFSEAVSISLKRMPLHNRSPGTG